MHILKGKDRSGADISNMVLFWICRLFDFNTEIIMSANSSPGTLELLLFSLSSPLSATSEILAFKQNLQVPVVCFISDGDFEMFCRTRSGTPGKHQPWLQKVALCSSYPVSAHGNTRRNARKARGCAAAQRLSGWETRGQKEPSMYFKPQNLVSGMKPGEIIQVSRTEEYP